MPLTFTWRKLLWGTTLTEYDSNRTVAIISVRDLHCVCKSLAISTYSQADCIRKVEQALQEKFTLRQGDRIVYEGFSHDGVTVRELS